MERASEKSPIRSFFKVMIGKDFSKHLFLPPKFARALVDQTTYLEDSSGRHWAVTLSNVDGSLAFQKGWHEFSSDHGLKVGDFLVFNYISDSHFNVLFYGRSGCQEYKLAEENVIPRNGCRTNFIAEDKPWNMMNNGSKNKQGSIFSNGLQSEFVDEAFVLIDRDAGYGQGECYKSSLYDLSNFETARIPSEADGSNKVSVEAVMDEKDSDAGQVSKPTGNGNSRSTSKIVRCQKRRRSTLSSGSMKVIKKEPVETGELRSYEELLHGKGPDKISGREQGSGLPSKDDKVSEVVKNEAAVSFDLSTPDAADISCMVEIGSRTFFELPKSLPSISFRKLSTEKKVVHLRDPVSRLWPVFYHQKHGLNVLAKGWKEFSKANNIQPGYNCVFGVENEAESIYRVGIIPN